MLKGAKLGRFRLGSRERSPTERPPTWVCVGWAYIISLIILSLFSYYSRHEWAGTDSIRFDSAVRGGDRLELTRLR